MADAHSFLDDPDGTQEAIMKATYHALCEHGYAGLTIQRIGDRFEKSKSLLYHHYDSKDDLLLDFLAFMLEEFRHSVPIDEAQPADDQLDALLDRILMETFTEEQRNFTQAMVELRAQAAHDERYRDHFTRSDRFFYTQLVDIIQTGVEEDRFREVDPERIAAILLTIINGAMTQRITTEFDLMLTVRDELRAYIETRLLTEDAE